MSLEAGTVLPGKVTGISKFGVFVALENGQSGMVHISEIANTYVTAIEDHVKVGQEVRVKVLNIDEKGRINLSMKRAEEGEKPSAPTAKPVSNSAPPKPAATFNPPPRQPKQPASFEDLLQKFKQESEERQSETRLKEMNRAAYAKRSRY